MNKLFPIMALIALSCLSSCVKSFDCVCATTTDYGGGNVESGSLTKSFSGPEFKAKTNCNAEDMSYTVDDYTYTAECELK